jgi:hypothetical protein
MGRPQIPIDEHRVEKLAAIGASAEEIAAELAPIGKKSLNVKTIRRRFGQVLKKGARMRDLRLRSALIREALKGNPPALIFACKVLLGMKEPRDDAVTVNVTQNAISVTDETKRRLSEMHALLRREALLEAQGNGNGEQG